VSSPVFALGTTPHFVPDPLTFLHILYPPLVRSKNEIIGTYVVRDGDTLLSIAALFGVSPDAILAANHLPNDFSLYVGETLSIPPFVGEK
jgi:LysM repeat protein